MSGRYSIVKSIDGGGTWARCDSGFEFDWELGPLALSINPQDPDIVLCSTGGPMGGNFYRTTNGGKRWTVVTDSTGVTVGGIYGITYDIENPNLVFASDYYFGHFYISYDGGIVWYMRTRYIGGATTILFNNEDQTLYLASLHGMYKSADTGKTWISIMNGIPGTRSGPYTVAIKENNTLFIGGFATDDSSFARFGVYRSGKSEVFWNFIGLDSERINTLIVTKNGNFLYAGANESGYDTRRGVYRLSLLTGIEERKDYVPENIFLNSYPNPFNNSITITYSLPVTLEIGISIYNILGRKVSTLLHAMQYSGDHAVRWDGTDALGNTVPSGMYFIFFETFEEKKSPSLKPLMKKILYVR